MLGDCFSSHAAQRSIYTHTCIISCSYQSWNVYSSSEKSSLYWKSKWRNVWGQQQLVSTSWRWVSSASCARHLLAWCMHRHNPTELHNFILSWKPFSSCSRLRCGVMYRLGELSKSLSQQYSVASELRRNLEAEAALHTSNVSSGILPINHLTGCCLWVLSTFCCN